MNLISNQSSVPVLLWLCLLLAPVLLFSQTPAPPPAGSASQDTSISNLFPAGAKLQWVRYYRGLFDDVSEIMLSLGYDGSNCRGYLRYAESKEQFRLSGSLDGMVLALDESDEKGMITGHITGALHGEQIAAEWTNAVNTLGSRLEAQESKSKNPLHEHCGDNKWVSRYIARWNNARVDLTLARMNNGNLNGYLWVEADDRTYALKGKISPDESYEIQAILPNGKTAAHLQGNFKDPHNSDCLWIGSGEKRAIKITLRYRFQVGCLEYADYTCSYDALYPRTGCADCNEVLDRRVADWVARCQSVIAAQNKPRTPEHRNALRASSWYEVTCWTETIFCGYLTFAESWEENTSGASFNFDLRTGKEITYDDLFNRGFNAKEWFADYARRESPKMAKFAADPQFREWLQESGFPMFTIRRDGLELSTLFHPTYGQYRVTVPYSLLKPNMRRDNPITDLVK